MQRVDFDNLIKSGSSITKPLVVTIGVFDGLHLGHRKLIADVKDLSRMGKSCVVSFKQNPVSVLRPDEFLGNILTLEEKLFRMEGLGVEHVVLIDFSPNFSKLSGEEFLSLLFENLDIRYVVVGYNFGFGYRRSMDAFKLRDWALNRGIGVKIQEPVMYRGEVVSSSRIRKCIVEGNIGEANYMLHEKFSLFYEGMGELLEHRDVYWKFAKSTSKQVIPPVGEYRVKVYGEDEWGENGIEDFSVLYITENCLELELGKRMKKLKKIVFDNKNNRE